MSKKEISEEINNLNDFDIYQSFNKGGLANGWGANCIPYNENEVVDWNIDQKKFFLSQKKIFDELHVSKVDDNINKNFNISNFGSESPISLDERDIFFLKKFNDNYKFFLNEKVEFGKARLAIKNSDTNDSCKLTSRCLWGCPQNAIYNPNYSTLKSVKHLKDLNTLKIEKFHILI